MANRRFGKPYIYGDDRVICEGSFAPNGSSALVADDVKGIGFSVVRTSAGLFTITFDDAFPAFESAHATLQLASGGDQIIQIGTWTASTKKLQIRVWDISGAAVADVAADANNRIHFTAVFRNTGVR